MSRILATVALSLVLAAAGFVGVLTAPVRSQSTTVEVAIDADVAGNIPRLAASIEECASAAVGSTVEVDIVVPEPGIPSDRGIAAFELEFYYDLNVIEVVAVDHNQLLRQAQGSALFPVGSELPNAGGELFAVVADLGKAGVEPAGTSEVGPGVISRLTVQVVGAGVTPLGLRGVDLRDDAGEPITIGEPRRGTLYSGAPCPAPSATPSPTPGTTVAAGTPTVAPASTAGGIAGGPASGVGSLAAGSRGAPAWAMGSLAGGLFAGAASAALLGRNRRRRPRPAADITEL
jgi:hypothetical protein